MSQDIILNGRATGDVASVLLANNFDVRALRPFLGPDNVSYITMNHGDSEIAVPTGNASATLRKDQWQMLDTAIVKAAKERLRVVSDFRGAGLQYVLQNGMAYTVLQTERQSDINDATISMDGIRQGENDRPLFDLMNLPLPIIHKDFSFSTRQIATSQNPGGSPLDTTTAELAARRVAEKAERYMLGLEDYTYGGGQVYGFLNFPQRMTKAMSTPDGTNNATVLAEVLQMIDQSRASNHYGPFMLYCSPNWAPWLDADYSIQYPNLSLRQRLRNIEQVRDVRTVDYLPSDAYTMVLVQMTSDVVRVVVGMEMMTVQWDSHGGMQKNFKVMTILVPQLRADYNGNTGIVHGTASL